MLLLCKWESVNISVVLHAIGDLHIDACSIGQIFPWLHCAQASFTTLAHWLTHVKWMFISLEEAWLSAGIFVVQNTLSQWHLHDLTSQVLINHFCFTFHSIYHIQFPRFLQMPKEYFDSCHIPVNANENQLRTEYGIEKVHNCSSPNAHSVFLSYIDNFLPLPGGYGGLVYESGQEYYFTCK